MNEVIREVLNFLFLFFFTKRFCTHQKSQKAQKTPKNTKKTQKRNQAKSTKNANKRTKIKSALKKHLSGKK